MRSSLHSNLHPPRGTCIILLSKNRSPCPNWGQQNLHVLHNYSSNHDPSKKKQNWQKWVLEEHKRYQQIEERNLTSFADYNSMRSQKSFSRFKKAKSTVESKKCCENQFRKNAKIVFDFFSEPNPVHRKEKSKNCKNQKLKEFNS